MSTDLRVFSLPSCELVAIAQDEQTLLVRLEQIPGLISDLMRCASRSAPGGETDISPAPNTPLGEPLAVVPEPKHSNVIAFRCHVDESCGQADPKDDGYHSLHADLYDMREGK